MITPQMSYSRHVWSRRLMIFHYYDREGGHSPNFLHVLIYNSESLHS
uniref:Uncharacterized protein n=1 Tax=Anguilla anguilla TaxID=7936 RepID=A0A0E9XKD1_ANGAN